jgi:hypothetical protein
VLEIFGENMLAEPSVQWVTASPLWNIPQQTPVQMQQPAILRFASDTFMEDLAQQLQKAPQDLSNRQAIPESFRELLPGETGDTPPPPAHLKLYQPTHGHFCLITANLVCRVVGLPDKVVDTTQNERVGFIIRRRLSENNLTEFAWVSTSETPNGKTWLQLPSGTEQTLAEHEELLPLFPLNFVDNRQQRRLLIGLIPTSSRETFKATATTLPSPFDTPAPTPPTKPPSDPRMDEFQSNIIDLIQQHLQAPRIPPVSPVPPPDDVQKKMQEQNEQEASLFVLLDCATFLARYPSPGAASLWNAIYTAIPPADSAGKALYHLLRTSHINDATNEPLVTWQKALQTVWDLRNAITGLESGTTTAPTLPTYNLRYTTIDCKELHDKVRAAIKPYQAPALLPANDLVPLPKLNATGTATPLFSLRCVYQRTRCGAVQNIVSESSVLFEIASFFDFDAPARPIRISLPVDTSIASLRKFKKNVSFVISNKLRQQMEGVTNLKSVMDGNIASGQEFDLGVICSFAIPIITICAMLVLMIFLVLLNIVFWWLPFVRICFPIPLISKK